MGYFLDIFSSPPIHLNTSWLMRSIFLKLSQLAAFGLSNACKLNGSETSDGKIYMTMMAKKSYEVL